MTQLVIVTHTEYRWYSCIFIANTMHAKNVKTQKLAGIIMCAYLRSTDLWMVKSERIAFILSCTWQQHDKIDICERFQKSIVMSVSHILKCLIHFECNIMLCCRIPCWLLAFIYHGVKYTNVSPLFQQKIDDVFTNFI